ncbi:putative plant self-incompatibility S1 [Helianthus annuus]|nr:putative plant self-incompatibility S1 [Helianthus annuus]KAJ0452212.1 putative plant self-incompatibility S1 [Helianthus annuus]
MKSLFFLLFFILMTIDASPTPPNGTEKFKWCWMPYWSVEIINLMHDPFTVHPQSADDDLGNRTLAYRQNTNWDFCLHITLKTRFYAHFYWNSKTAFFDVYSYGLGESYCTNGKEFIKEQTCYWMVTEDGFYVTRHPDQFPGGGPTKLHDWS